MKSEGTADYVATPDLMVAVNAAAAPEPPLPVAREPRTGRTSLARPAPSNRAAAHAPWNSLGRGPLWRAFPIETRVVLPIDAADMADVVFPNDLFSGARPDGLPWLRGAVLGREVRPSERGGAPTTARPTTCGRMPQARCRGCTARCGRTGRRSCFSNGLPQSPEAGARDRNALNET
jgi:hypothetical protein